MIRVCFSTYHIGNRIFGEKKPLKDKSETHGLCEDCFKIEMAELEQRNQIREHKDNELY